MNRRVFLGWAGLTGYGTWLAFRPAPTGRKPPKPTTTTAPTTTTLPSGGVFAAVFPPRF